jgi:Mn2+/Fe2+ NRAMP family transporter
MSFRRFPDLRQIQRRIFPANTRPRQGGPENRGKVLHWPAELREKPLFWAYSTQTSFLKRVLPGMVTGAADVDPSLVITATVVGVYFGYELLWVVLLCVPFLLTIFSVSARIGHETRMGLVDLLRSNYGQRIARACAGLIVLINLVMIVADLLAVSDALSIILDQRRIFFVALIAFGVWYVLIFSDYQKITRALAFLALPLFIYVLIALYSAPSVTKILQGMLVPRGFADASYAEAVLGIFGSLLTPYVLVWQTSSRRDSAIAGEELHESAHRMGVLVTTILCFSIIVTAGTVLRGVAVPGGLTTKQAAQAFGPVFGEVGPILFALGIIGAGMVALPVLVASLCYSVSESMGWEYGLSTNPWEAKRFYVLISAALVIAATLNFLRLDPVRTLYFSQILAGALTVPILAFILLLSNDRRVMRTVNSRAQNFWIGAAAGGLSATGLLLFWANM